MDTRFGWKGRKRRKRIRVRFRGIENIPDRNKSHREVHIL